jgi:molecular chaperone DnaK
VTFDIDANGIVHVSAKDLGTGKEQKIRIESSSGLSEDEINNMVHEAEEHAEEDKRVRERAEARNEADNLVYTTEKSLKEYGDKVSEADRETIQSAIDELKKALEGDEVEEIRQKSEALKQASYRLAEEVYKQAGAQAQGAEQQQSEAGPEQPGEQGAQKENVEDVDYEVVDDEEKQ